MRPSIPLSFVAGAKISPKENGVSENGSCADTRRLITNLISPILSGDTGSGARVVCIRSIVPSNMVRA